MREDNLLNQEDNPKMFELLQERASAELGSFIKAREETEIGKKLYGLPAFFSHDCTMQLIKTEFDRMCQLVPYNLKLGSGSRELFPEQASWYLSHFDNLNDADF